MQTRAKLLLFLCLAAISGPTAASGALVPVTFGDSRSLQRIVDRRYGKNHIDVTKDYIGAHAGDVDPWFWIGDVFGAVRIKVLKRDSDLSLLGWYLESHGLAAYPPGGGVLFSGPFRPREEALVVLPGVRTRFGFYVDAPVPDSVPLRGFPRPTERFYTDRLLNDPGPDGKGATHAPFDGDVEALVFDVSRWAGTGTWLVCFDDIDTGGPLISVTDDTEDSEGDPQGGGGHCHPKHYDDNDEADDDEDGGAPGQGCDFDDAVFEVHADGATPARILTFGGLKLIYR